MRLLIIFLALTGFSSKPPRPMPAPIIGAPTLEPVKKLTISEIVQGSKCATYNWKNRGHAPKGYINGMALMFARSICAHEYGWKASIDTAQKVRSLKPQFDALAIYVSHFSRIGMSIDKDGLDTLRAVYVLGTGLGMRESSGKHCEGRDMSANWAESPTTETGMFQFSYQTMNAWPELAHIYAKYQADPSQCALEVFSQGVTCKASSAKNWGTKPEGLKFQKFTKECPAFAVEYGMVLLRSLRTHFGPINRIEAEVVSECNEMYSNIQNLVKSNFKTCESL